MNERNVIQARKIVNMLGGMYYNVQSEVYEQA
jgi:hypothetical protein